MVVDLIGQPVVVAGQVGPGVVLVVGHRTRPGASGGEVPVADGAQRLAPPLVRRIVAMEAVDPVVHGSTLQLALSISAARVYMGVLLAVTLSLLCATPVGLRATVLS